MVLTTTQTRAAAAEAVAARPPRFIAAVLAVAVFFVYWLSPVVQTTDSVWTVHTATSIVRHGDADVDEYAAPIDAAAGWKVVDANGHRYFDYPTGTIVLAVPFVAVARVLSPGFDDRVAAGVVPEIERFIASIFVAAAAVLLYAGARRRTGSVPAALIIAVLFALGTGAWSTASRALWQHGPVAMLLAALLVVLQRARTRPALVVWSAPIGVFAAFTRPTHALTVGILGLMVLVYHRRYAVRFTALAGATTALFLAFNRAVYGEALPSYFRNSPAAPERAQPLEGLIGNLVSPSRGLLVFSPFLCVGLVAALRAARQRRLDRVDVFAAAVALSQWAAISFLAPVWWGGYSFGPRFLVDIIPCLVWLCIPAVDGVGKLAQSRQVRLLAIAGLLSIWINAQGAIDQATFDWNRVDKDGNVISVHIDDARVWDWTDLQFLR